MVPDLVRIIDLLAETIEALDPPNATLAKMARLASNLAGKARGAAPPHPAGGGKGRRPDGRARNHPTDAEKPPWGLRFAVAFRGQGGTPSPETPKGGFHSK